MTLRIGGFATLIQAFDLPTSLTFYRDVMGFEVISDAPEDGRCEWVWLKSDDSELMLNTAYEAALGRIRLTPGAFRHPRRARRRLPPIRGRLLSLARNVDNHLARTPLSIHVDVAEP